MIILQVNIEGIFTLKSERHSPVAADCNAPRSSPITLQLMQAITRQVHVSRRASAVENI
ncbi:MAG TPA: hypothetical protein VGC73_11870 [Pyrinomonadaceae bacterium]